MGKTEVIDEIIRLQRRLGRIVVPRAIETWRELDVPLAQLKSLIIIASKRETNFSALAEELGVTRGNVTGIINRLVDQGLVSRKPSVDDRRTVWLHLTDKGRDLIIDLLESQVSHMTQILEYMSPENLESLSQGLEGLVEVMEKHYQELT
jgi:MarR family transcriptional regulator, organic hydroperoxide resistance regulator